MVAISTEDDGFTIVELLSDEGWEVGDIVRWADGHGLGSEVFVNVSQGTRSEVYVQNHGVSTQYMQQQILL